MNKAISWIVLIVGVLLVIAELGVTSIASYSGWLVAIGFLALGIKMAMPK